MYRASIFGHLPIVLHVRGVTRASNGEKRMGCRCLSGGSSGNEGGVASISITMIGEYPKKRRIGLIRLGWVGPSVTSEEDGHYNIVY